MEPTSSTPTASELRTDVFGLEAFESQNPFWKLVQRESDIRVMATAVSTSAPVDDSNREAGYNRSACTECQRRKQKVSV